MSDAPSTLLLSARVRPGHEAEFAQWQGRWQSALLAAADALSVEFWPPAPPDQLEAVALARFNSIDALRQWRRGEVNRKLVDEACAAGRRRPRHAARGKAAVEYSVDARGDDGHGH